MRVFSRSPLYTLVLIFFLAILLRFFFFPTNTQFAYDQARDAFISQDVLKGDIKIVGPPSSAIAGLHHGPLFYYIAAPIYVIANGNPEGLSLFLRLYNASGVIFTFLIASSLFNKRTGLFAALLYAMSFEQTQYALFMGHPTLAVITTLTFFLGLALLLFKQKPYGLILSTVSVGLSIQFHVGLVFLLPLLFIIPILFRKKLPQVSFSTMLWAFVGLLLTLSTFIVAEFKYGFKTTSSFLSLFQRQSTGNIDFVERIVQVVFIINRYVSDNFFSMSVYGLGIGVVFLLFFWMFRTKKTSTGFFLLVWFVWGLLPSVLYHSKIYFYSIGTSVSLLLLLSVFLDDMYKKNKLLPIFLLALIFLSNMYVIVTTNSSGPINTITSQNGMLLSDQKKIIDFTYEKAKGQKFAINALTIPYNVNTTWSYLYDWYGRSKYTYLPVWGGSHAGGYVTKFDIQTARSTLPEKRFLIIEQTQGLPEHIVHSFLQEENYYATTIATYSAGLLTVYEQVGYQTR